MPSSISVVSDAGVDAGDERLVLAERGIPVRRVAVVVVVVGLLQAALILRRRAVRAAVDQLAGALLASSTGRVRGRTVEAICTDLGIFPLRVLDHERPPVLRPTMSVRPRHLRMKVRTR